VEDDSKPPADEGADPERAGAAGTGDARPLDRGRVDIRRVASEAGVSTATVSRVVTGKGPVGEATRRRVLDVVARTRYQPSAPARSLRSARTLSVGVIVPDLANPVFVPLLRGVEHVAQAHDYAVLVVDAQRSASVEGRALDRLLARRVDLLVLAGRSRHPDRVEELRREGIVVVDPAGEGPAGTSLLDRLEEPGTEAMCRALAGMAHHHLGYLVRRRPGGGAIGRRWESVRRWCSALGLKATPLVLGGAAAPGGWAGALRHAVGSTGGPTALVCANHRMAPEVLAGLRDAGLAMPEDCSFVTYGDSPWAAAYRPALGVVALDLFAVASTLVEAAIAGLGTPGPTPEPAALPAARFHPRQSMGPPPTAPPGAFPEPVPR